MDYTVKCLRVLAGAAVKMFVKLLQTPGVGDGPTSNSEM
jgi:hypothetical protein